MPGDLASAYAHCESLLRAEDDDRWRAILFAPAESRPHLHALYAFSLEIARVRANAGDPMPGEIRYQWWRDALEGAAQGRKRAHFLGVLPDSVKWRTVAIHTREPDFAIRLLRERMGGDLAL